MRHHRTLVLPFFSYKCKQTIQAPSLHTSIHMTEMGGCMHAWLDACASRSVGPCMLMHVCVVCYSYPTRKYMDVSRVILQGTCRRVVSPAGTSTLLKTREFGARLSAHQRRSVEMQLPESRILVHIEIRGVPHREQQQQQAGGGAASAGGEGGGLATTPQQVSSPIPAAGARYPASYFTSKQFLTEHRETEPFTAADAALLISQRINDQHRHVWGAAKVVLWEADETTNDANIKVNITRLFVAAAAAVAVVAAALVADGAADVALLLIVCRRRDNWCGCPTSLGLLRACITYVCGVLCMHALGAVFAFVAFRVLSMTRFLRGNQTSRLGRY